jgi:hypothetical protein
VERFLNAHTRVLGHGSPRVVCATYFSYSYTGRTRANRALMCAFAILDGFSPNLVKKHTKDHKNLHGLFNLCAYSMLEFSFAHHSQMIPKR